MKAATASASETTMLHSRSKSARVMLAGWARSMISGRSQLLVTVSPTAPAELDLLGKELLIRRRAGRIQHPQLETSVAGVRGHGPTQPSAQSPVAVVRRGFWPVTTCRVVPRSGLGQAEVAGSAVRGFPPVQGDSRAHVPGSISLLQASTGRQLVGRRTGRPSTKRERQQRYLSTLRGQRSDRGVHHRKGHRQPQSRAPFTTKFPHQTTTRQ